MRRGAVQQGLDARDASGLVGAGDPEDEFVAAEARRHVAGRHGLVQQACGGAQRGVAGLVAMPVVERLQVVEVEEDENTWPAAQPRVERIEERTTVREAGQRVGAGLAFQLALHAVEAEHGAEHRGHRAQHGQVLGIPVARAGLAPRGQRAGRGRAAVVMQHRDGFLRLERAGPIGAGGERGRCAPQQGLRHGIGRGRDLGQGIGGHQHGGAAAAERVAQARQAGGDRLPRGAGAAHGFRQRIEQRGAAQPSGGVGGGILLQGHVMGGAAQARMAAARIAERCERQRQASRLALRVRHPDALPAHGALLREGIWPGPEQQAVGPAPEQVGGAMAERRVGPEEGEAAGIVGLEHHVGGEAGQVLPALARFQQRAVQRGGGRRRRRDHHRPVLGAEHGVHPAGMEAPHR